MFRRESERLFNESPEVELVSDKPINEPWMAFYLDDISSIEHFAEAIVNSKTARRVAIDKTPKESKIIVHLKPNQKKLDFRVNKKGFLASQFVWKMNNVTGGFDRLRLSLRGDFPFIQNHRSDIIRHLNVPMFEKNSIKGVYSIGLLSYPEKIQLAAKYIQTDDSRHSKLSFDFGKFFNLFNVQIFKVWGSHNPELNRTAAKLKYKSSDISYTTLPEGSSNVLKLQHDLAKEPIANWHLKWNFRGYLNWSFLPAYSNIEYDLNLSLSNYNTKSWQNLPGFPFNAADGSLRTASMLARHFLLKFNYYNIFALREFRISGFAFYAHMADYSGLSHQEVGFGFEKHIKQLGIRLQTFYGLIGHRFQVRFSQE